MSRRTSFHSHILFFLGGEVSKVAHPQLLQGSLDKNKLLRQVWSVKYQETILTNIRIFL